MKKIIVLLTICFLFLTSCASTDNSSNIVSREEYESVVAEVDELKSQIELLENTGNSNSVNPSNAPYIDDSVNDFDNQIFSPTETFELIFVDQFTFEWDDNNKFYISKYRDENNNLIIIGNGVYEEENLSLLQYNYYYMCTYPYNFAVKNIEFIFIVGENEYSFKVSNGKIIIDTVPMDNVSDISQNYSGKAWNSITQVTSFYDF